MVELEIVTHLDSTNECQKVEFDTFWLWKCAYEKAAKDGGLVRDLTWTPVHVSDTVKDDSGDSNDHSWDRLLQYHIVGDW